MTVYYRLKIYYYQYNDGSSNNGHFSTYVNFETEDAARAIKKQIDDAIANDNAVVGMEDSDDTLPDYIPGAAGGYYEKSPKLFRITSEEIT